MQMRPRVSSVEVKFHFWVNYLTRYPYVFDHIIQYISGSCGSAGSSREAGAAL